MANKAAALAVAAALLAYTPPSLAKDSLGVFSDWGAFRDPTVPRCYAIAKARPSKSKRDYEPYASVGTWPKRGLRNQIHIRLSRELSSQPAIVLRIRNKKFDLTGGGGDAWAPDKRMDAAIVASMRSASRMTVIATDAHGRRFSDTYSLTGVATAMDAAIVGCARLG